MSNGSVVHYATGVVIVFPVREVYSREAESLEQLGTKPKFWFTDENGQRMLFKADQRGTGEDWAEKIACELCGLLGLPHVYYELAIDRDKGNPGVVCPTCSPPPMSLVLGNQLLLAHDAQYPTAARCRYKVQEHTIKAVVDVIKAIQPPPPEWLNEMPNGIVSAVDIFAGYIMLDAWIGNQDRHHENWAALRVGNTLQLAPTFDHGAAMARQITDQERQQRLATRDSGYGIPRFVRSARSAFYRDPEAKKSMTTIEAWRAFSLYAPDASMIWLGRLRMIDDDGARKILEEVPLNRLSGIGRDFTHRLLIENRKRILNGDEK